MLSLALVKTHPEQRSRQGFSHPKRCPKRPYTGHARHKSRSERALPDSPAARAAERREVRPETAGPGKVLTGLAASHARRPDSRGMGEDAEPPWTPEEKAAII